MFNSNTTQRRFIACMSAFAFSGAQALMIALYPVLAWALNLNLSSLIFCFSLGSFMFLFGSPYWSQKSDRWGRHKVLTIGTAASLVCFAALVFLVYHSFANAALNVLILIVSRVIYGLVASATIPAAQAIHADLAGKSGSVRAMMLHSMSISLGRVAGFALIVCFYGQFKTVLLLYLLLVVAVFFINFTHRKEVPVSAQSIYSSEMKMSINQPHPFPEPPSWKFEALNIKWVIAIAFFFTCFVESLYSSLSGTIKNLFQLDSLISSGLSAEILLMMSIGIFLVQSAGKTLVKESWKTGIFVGVGALLIGSVCLTNAHSLFDLWFCVAFFVIGIGLIPPLYLSMLRTGSSSAQYGKRAGIIASAHTLGYACGGAISAVLFKTGTLSIGFILGIIVICLGFSCLKQSKIMSRIRAQEIL